MEFRLLGPVEAVLDGAPVALGGPKPRALLAALALNCGRAVTPDHLIGWAWNDEPGENARNALYTYISTLRRALAAEPDREMIVRSAAGYTLDVDVAQVDVHAFTRQVAIGRRALAEGRPETAARLLGEALSRWRGEPLGGLSGLRAEAERARLEEARQAADEDRLDAELALGRGDRLVAELIATVGERPLAERSRAQLMLALSQAGRVEDALACYREGRQVLLDELGVEPGHELRQAYERIVRAEVTPRTTAAAPPVLHQLPADIADFTGRTGDVERLCAHLRAGTGTAVRLCAISGKPGAGKSTLALRVAHLVRDEFPGGQLYANLEGVHARPADPAEVLAGFLRALGIPDATLPENTDDRARLFRSTVDGRRILVVLDDAGSEQQVRPLLPGGPDCAVLVTGRERLTGLAGSLHRDLPVLTAAESVTLLGRIAGPERANAEHADAVRIVRMCGHLPLAVRIAGARLAARPQWPLARLAERLQAQHRVLAELAIGDLEVRGSLALSYDGLAEAERVALRRLGRLEVHGFASWLVAPLVGCSLAEADDLVENLVDSQLVDAADVEGTDTGRFRLHDLTRAFGRERAEAEENDAEIRAAVTRIAECYLMLVGEAATRTPNSAYSGELSAAVSSYLDSALIERLLADPRAWFDLEQATLVSVVERAAELDLSDVAIRLAATLCTSSFALNNQFSQWWHTHTVALAAGRRAGDRAGEGRLLAGLGRLRAEQDRYEESASYYEQALRAYQDAGHVPGQASTYLALSSTHREQGRLQDSLANVEQALRMLTEPQELARAHHGHGMTLTEIGALPEAMESFETALAAYTTIGRQIHGEALVLRSIAIVHRAAGRLSEASAAAQEAVGWLRSTGDRLMLAYATQTLAKVRIRQGLGESVRADLRECLATCHAMQDGFGQGLMLRTLGELESAVGDPDAARPLLERSLQWWQALRLPLWRARTLRELAVVLAASGDDGANAAWAEASSLFRAHGSREASEPRPVAARRPGLPQRSPAP